METHITESVVNPTKQLAEVFLQYELYGIVAFFGILVVGMFLIFVWRLRAKDNEIASLIRETNVWRDSKDIQIKEIIENHSKQEDAYGDLLEGRHQQFCEILERAISAMNAMTAADERLRVQLKSIEDKMYKRRPRYPIDRQGGV